MKNKNRFLLIVAFVSGFCIMAMEISASRLLAPYFGTSIFVWTNIIGIVMVALSLGYYFGGKLADRIPKIELLLKLIFSAGCLFLIVPLIIKPLSSMIDLGSLGLHSSAAIIFISSLLLTTILFALPLILLGMVSPFIIKLFLLEKDNQVGESAGRVSAVSTIGSILGTFLPTLLLIPVWGTRATINIFALILIALGSLGFRKKKTNLLFLAVLTPAFYFSGAQINTQPESIFEDESAYQYINIRQDAQGTKYLSVNEGAGIQSVYNSERALTGYYYDYLNVLPYLLKSEEPKKVLIVGLCGGTIANQLSHFFPGELEIDGVEIDPKIINAAQKYFNINQTNTQIYNADGRMFLAGNSKKYDLIIVDAYAQEFYIPWTLTTQEFWGLVKENLTPTGIMAINVNSVSPSSRLLKSIANTMASVFPNTYITPIKDGNINYVLTASRQPLNFSDLTEAVENNELKSLAWSYQNNTEKIGYDANAMILTDDRAPVEFLTDSMALDYLKK
ncbi:MAG TPA: fused MFS/spermidine synthase [bacterium]|nr:fused MFS/spermidine synthase [bacterium]HPT29987.1 fused MFS/spermidine synthase [bacterium]